MEGGVLIVVSDVEPSGVVEIDIDRGRIGESDGGSVVFDFVATVAAVVVGLEC